jgi:hypothetical protein
MPTIKDAKYFSQAAAVLQKLAEDAKPQDPNGPYKNSETLIAYHLRSAATLAQKIAEHKAAREK